MRFVITNSCDFSNLLDIRGPDVVTVERQPHYAALFARKARDADAPSQIHGGRHS
jgi:hypothetical protein